MNPQVITSRKNENIQEAVKLIGSAEYRHTQGLFVVEGARLCRDAAISGVTVQKVFYTAQAEEKYPDYLHGIFESAGHTGVTQAYQIEPHVADALSSTKTTQGIFCVCAMPSDTVGFDALKKTANGRPCHYIALENIQDPANLGAVLRTAEALGISGALLIGACCDVYSPKVLRASMGAVFRLPFVSAGDIPTAAKQLHAAGFSTYAAVPAADAERITGLDFSKPSVIAVGNEGNGLTHEAINACSAKVTIPMLGRAESLNAASSAAILMWEMMRNLEG